MRQVVRRHLLVFLLALSSAVAAAFYAGVTLRINTDNTDLLSADIPFRQNDIALRETFPGAHPELIAIVEGTESGRAETAARSLVTVLAARSELFSAVRHAPSDPFFRRNGLLYLTPAELEDMVVRLAGAAPLIGALRQDPSLGGLAALFERAFDYTEESGDAEQLGALLDALGETAERFAADEVWPLSWQSLLAGTGQNEAGGEVQVILLYPKLDYASLKPVAAAVAAVREAFASLPDGQRAGAKLYLSGSALMLQEELETIESGMFAVALAALAAVACLLWLGLGSWRAVSALILTLLAGLAWTAAFAALTIGTLNLISVAFAVLFIGLGVDFGIHFFVRLLDDDSADLPSRIVDAGGRCGGVLGLCALSSAIAFYAFLPTDFRGLSELGLISGTAMFIALAATFTVLPAALLTFRWSGAGPAGDGGKLARFVLSMERAARVGPWRVVTLAALAGVVSVAFLPLARFDDDPMNLRDPDSSAVAALKRFASEDLVSYYRGELILPDVESGRRLADKLAELPTVRRVRGLDDLIPGEQEEKLDLLSDLADFLPPSLTEPPSSLSPDDVARRAALLDLRRVLLRPDSPQPEQSARLAGILETFEDAAPDQLLALEGLLLGDLEERIADLEESLRAQAITLQSLPSHYRHLWQAPDGRVRVSVQPRDDLSDQADRATFVQSLQSLAPEAGGIPVVIFEAGRAVLAAFAEALLYAVAAIFLLLWLRLRSAIDAVLVIAPLALAGTVTVALTAALDWPFNFANVIVLPLLFGLGIDSGIHVVSRARRFSGGPEEGRTLQAILLSSMTTVASFGALSFSTHPGIASMGLLLTVAILLGLIATLVVLPALLALRDRGSTTPGERQTEAGAD